MVTADASGASAAVVQTYGAPTQIVVVDRVRSVLETALACADAALDPQVGRAALYPGSSVAWDDCCDGQVWARLISLVPGGNPITNRNLSTPCGVIQWIATLGVGALRCASTMDDQGNAPSPAALTADTLQMSADLAVLAQALQCCLAPTVAKLSMLRWDPLGPEGGCVGGEWTFTVIVDNCACP